MHIFDGLLLAFALLFGIFAGYNIGHQNKKITPEHIQFCLDMCEKNDGLVHCGHRVKCNNNALFYHEKD